MHEIATRRDGCTEKSSMETKQTGSQQYVLHSFQTHKVPSTKDISASSITTKSKKNKITKSMEAEKVSPNLNVSEMRY